MRAGRHGQGFGQLPGNHQRYTWLHMEDGFGSMAAQKTLAQFMVGRDPDFIPATEQSHSFTAHH